MPNKKLDINVICPNCKTELSKKKNKLLCKLCGSKYSVKKGIPIMVDPKVDDHLMHQINYFSNEKITKETEYKLYPWQESYVNRFLDNFKNIKGKLVLDAGTGSGYMAIELAKKGANVVCTDLTFGSLLRLKRISKKMGLEDKMTFVCCDTQSLPLESNKFNYYISNAVFEHLPNDKKAIQEMNRVCKKTGAGVLVAVPLSIKYLNPLLIPLNLIHDKRIGHLRRYDSYILDSRLTGWKQKKVYYTGHFMKVLKTGFNIVFYKAFSEKSIEEIDNRMSEHVRGASNIIGIYAR